jgi:two-component sensor histidine kinase
VEDITEFKKAGWALQKNEMILRALIDNAPFQIWARDLNSIGILENKRLLEGFGSILGQTPKSDPKIDPKVTLLWESNNKRAFNGEIIDEECEYEINNQQFKFQQIIFPIYNETKIFGIAGFNIDITERTQAEEKIKSLLSEKELILKEIHHRVKNNMTTLSALFSLQIDTLKEPTAIAAIEDARSRVQCMLILYDKLYLSTNFANVSMKKYIPSLVDEILANFPNSKLVKSEKYIDDFILDLRKLQALGIIINELLTNIMKYAFIGRNDGNIIIIASLKATTTKDSNIVSLSIQDNGNGLPESVDFEKSTGFGIKLVKMLTNQLKGTIQIERENGTKFILEFEVSL